MKRAAAAPILAQRVSAPPPGRTVEAQHDLDLFVDQVCWLGKHLRDPSRLGVMSWIGRVLRPEVRDQLRSFFRADHPAHLQAELELLTLLRRPWQKQAPQYARLDMPERNVDWARTHIEELTSPPVRFWAREMVPMLDGGLLAGLCSLGRTMLDLGTFGNISADRRATRDALRDAIARVARAIGQRDGVYTHLHEQRLLRMGGETRKSALTIRAYLAFWRELFGGDDDVVRMRAFGQEIEEADLRCGHRTLDSLLEISAAIAIVRAAAATRDVTDLPNGLRWEIEDVDERDERNVPSIVLRSGTLTCSISKKAPQGDTFLSLFAEMGILSSGNQPDIVMTFSKRDDEGRESEIVILADAKRNAEQDGKRYLTRSVKAAIVYAVSFGHKMGLRIHPDGQGRIDGEVLPAVSLFCRQGVPLVAGAGPRHEDIVARLRSADRLPAVMALDLGHFFIGEGKPTWNAAIVSAWFGRIAREASAALDRRLKSTQSNTEGHDHSPNARSVPPPPRRERVRRESGGTT